MNANYGANVQATGGTIPYTWRISAGALPPGLLLGPSTGTISGTPTKSGSFSFTISLVDGTMQTATQALSIRIKRK